MRQISFGLVIVGAVALAILIGTDKRRGRRAGRCCLTAAVSHRDGNKADTNHLTRWSDRLAVARQPCFGHAESDIDYVRHSRPRWNCGSWDAGTA